MTDAALAPGPGVRWLGAQRDVLKGDLRGHVALDALAAAPHLYALGALEGVRGEVTILDSRPSIARIERDAVVTESTWSVRACFLAWAQVPAWDERGADDTLSDLLSLEGMALTLAEAGGFDLGRPFLGSSRRATPMCTCTCAPPTVSCPATSRRFAWRRARAWVFRWQAGRKPSPPRASPRHRQQAGRSATVAARDRVGGVVSRLRTKAKSWEASLSRLARRT